MKDKTIRNYIAELAKLNKREDNRKAMDYRKIDIEVNPIQRANGSARVKLGETEVIVGVKLDVGEPFPDTPASGILIVNSELSPLASPHFEPGPPKAPAIELARVVDRSIRESKSINVDKLCIKEKEKVWIIFVDIYPINYDGNLFDAAALAAMIALKNAKLPKYDEKQEKVMHEELTTKKLPIEQVPVLCTFGKISDSLFVDPTERETAVLDTRISIATIENGNLCAMQKGETGTFTQKEVMDLVKITRDKGKEIFISTTIGLY